MDCFSFLSANCLPKMDMGFKLALFKHQGCQDLCKRIPG